MIRPGLRILTELLLRAYIWLQRWRLPLAFPYYNMRQNRGDPFRANLLYPPSEWAVDSPAESAAVLGDVKRDRILFHGYNIKDDEQLLISFERVARALSQVWIVLHFQGKTLTFDRPLSLDSSSENTYSSDSIRLACDAPMRRWRLAFNGVMLESGTGHKVHTKFGIRFACGSHPFEWPNNLPVGSLSSVCPPRSLGTTLDQLKGLDSFDQFGSFYTDLSVGGTKVTKPYFGGRIKEVGAGALENLLSQRPDGVVPVKHLFGYANNGTMIHCLTTAGRREQPAGPKNAIGCVFSPCHFMKPMRNGILEKTGNVTTLSFKGAHLPYQLHVERRGNQFEFRGRGEYTVQMLTGSANVGGTVFKVHLFEVVTSRCNQRPAIPTHLLALTPPSIATEHPQTQPLLVSTSDDVARQPNLTGGKGTSLAVLTALSRQSGQKADSTKFTVPKAVILTVHAYSIFEKQRDVARATEELHGAATSTTNVEALRSACSRCEKALQAARMPLQVSNELSTALLGCFGTDWQSCRFAVRSSALGEDSEEMSAAGQMMTSLGVQGQASIETAVLKCWASQFAFTAVQYKRQYGESVCSRMAVVVQEMVDAEAAGVMFTCEPVTGNPLYSAITSTVGLGEAVVSSAVEPDTFVVDKRNDNAYVISEKTIGTKSVVIEQGPSGGTVRRPALAKEAACASLKDSDIIRLSKVGDTIDHSYGVARDIEWALKKGDIYLLQCRPVTSVFRESDYEISHDDDSALRTDRELLSRANVDEVLPGCLPALTLSLFRFMFDNLGKYIFLRVSPACEFERSAFPYSGGFSIGKRVYMNFSEPGFRGHAGSMNMMLALFGRDISKDEAFVNSIGHNRPSAWYKKLDAAFCILKGIYQLKRTVEAARLMEKNFKMKITDDMNSKQIIDVLIHGLHEIDQGGAHLMAVSLPLMVMNLIMILLVAKINGTAPNSPATTTLYSRLVKSKFDVESANIPASMARLSKSIRRSSKGSHVKEMTDEDLLKWLQRSPESAAKSYRAFVERHGHRCYKEFDLISDPWECDPVKLVRSLKTTALAGGREGVEDDGITLDDLPKKPSLGQRLVLRWLVPRAKYAVYAREATKSSLIYVIHKVRLAARSLGRQMEKEGRLPSAHLVYFLGFEELHRLVHHPSKSPLLVTKATRRRNLHGQLDKQKFNILQCGMPQPIVEESLPPLAGVTELHGTPVSEGVAEGYARVVSDFEAEAHLVSKGEILVTHATDTGWTPYFPLLSAIVTEIGGFLSHGAVVAREFGLPAVVGIRNVTRHIAQGDFIRVDGRRGSVTILRRAKPASP